MSKVEGSLNMEEKQYIRLVTEWFNVNVKAGDSVQFVLNIWYRMW